MTKLVAAAVVGVVAVAGIVGVLIANQPKKKAETTSSTSSNTQKVTETTDSTQIAEGTVNMDISNFAFAQKELKVKKGTKVVWTNRDSMQHNVHSDKDGGPRGELLSQGESYSFTFDQLGTFNYICEPHPYMKGSVEVVE